MTGIHFTPGLLKRGIVKNAPNQVNNTVDVRVGLSVSAPTLTSDLHYVYADNNGVFIGAVPPSNNPALLLQEQAGKHQAISYYPTNISILPKLDPGQLLLKNNENTRILFNENNITLGQRDGIGLVLGTNSDQILDTSSNNNFNYQFSFPQSGRKIDGAIKREIVESTSSYNLKLIDDFFYKNNASKICLIDIDNIEKGNFAAEDSDTFLIKNPSFTESREILYEFAYDYDVADLQTEACNYNKNLKAPPPPENDRRKSRADTLSLSLTAPNYLMESVKGTVVDIYGNLLDLNRFPIKHNLENTNNNSSTNNYYKIRQDQRRSLAYHFEINARKDLGETNASPNVKSTADYARDRSRFFIDVDKEGQFKINVPASSNNGNIPLLTRYENYNTIVAAEDPTKSPNELLFPDNKIDILHDSFAAGVRQYNTEYESKKLKIQEQAGYNKGIISIINKDGAEIAPIDRVSKDLTDGSGFAHIKHGTAHHDITATCIAHQISQLVNYIYSEPQDWNTFVLQPLQNGIITTEIKVGENAGGRSGSINLDGSLELNIGANTIDRQSLWLDTAGGLVANIGRDKQNISAAINMDGQLVLQIGGYGIDKDQDSRFASANNAYASGAIDIRVMVEGNSAAVFRIDKGGIYLVSPSRIFIESNNNIDIRSASNIAINAETVTIQDRVVEKQVTSGVLTI